MRVDFYHLQIAPLEKVLPVLVEKAYQSGQRILIRTQDESKASFLETLLWTYKPESWLPHGCDTGAEPSNQPILISSSGENLNQADIVLLTNGATLEEIKGFKRCLNLFDGHNAHAVQEARELWKATVSKGFEAYYWQQNQAGRWEMKTKNSSKKETL